MSASEPVFSLTRATPTEVTRPNVDCYSLVLFISGASTPSARAIRHVQGMCEQHLSGRYELAVVDVRQEHQLVERYRVLATPTLMRRSPPPELMRVGDFSDYVAVLSALGLGAAGNA